MHTIDLLKKIVAYEEKQVEDRKKSGQVDAEQYPTWWRLGELGIGYHEVKELIREGILLYQGNGWCRLNSREETKKLINSQLQYLNKVSDIDNLQPPLFSVIEGMDEQKELFIRALKSKSPVHILMAGPPATAKSLFLSEIERLGGAIYVTGGGTTKAGLREVLIEHPDLLYLLVDEIDKADRSDLDCLLSVCESGKVYQHKHGLHREVALKVKVFAACNDISKLPRELVDRFLVVNIAEYSEEDIKKVATKMLSQYGYSDEFITFLIDKCFEHSIKRVRTIRALAHLCDGQVSNLGLVDKYVKYYQ